MRSAEKRPGINRVRVRDTNLGRGRTALVWAEAKLFLDMIRIGNLRPASLM